MNKLSCIIILLSFVTALSSCSKYLEVNPDNRVRLETVDDYKAVINGAYPQAYHHFTELYTDNVRYYDYPDYNQANITSWLFPIYLWSDSYVSTAISPNSAWRKYYNDIYESNIVLEGIDKATGDDALRESIKGEAYMIRAYCHFMLVNIFAKHYIPATADTDLGIPYAMEYEKEPGQQYERPSVQYVYDRIEEDALKALAMIDESYMGVPKLHWSKASIHAFLSRFYLFKEDWDRSLFHSEEVFKINSNIRDFIADYDTYFSKDHGQFANQYFDTKQGSILLVNYSVSWNIYNRGSLYANEFISQFHANDLRGKIYSRWNVSTPNYMARKFRSDEHPSGDPHTDIALFVVEEVMYNAAEASVRKNNPNFQYAIDKLNAILKQRWRPFVALDVSNYSDQDALVAKILDEKNKELCYEGYRWFDIKRHEITVRHWDGRRYIDLLPDDKRRLVQIPFEELEANPKMKPNPR